MNSVDKKLINFRCDLDVLDGFDEVCDFKRTNRTQTLIELMRDYVVNKSDEIQRWNTVYQMTGRKPRVGV
jgi:hypothetical protein